MPPPSVQACIADYLVCRCLACLPLRTLPLPLPQTVSVSAIHAMSEFGAFHAASRVFATPCLHAALLQVLSARATLRLSRSRWQRLPSTEARSPQPSLSFPHLSSIAGGFCTAMRCLPHPPSAGALLEHRPCLAAEPLQASPPQQLPASADLRHTTKALPANPLPSAWSLVPLNFSLAHGLESLRMVDAPRVSNLPTPLPQPHFPQQSFCLQASLAHLLPACAHRAHPPATPLPAGSFRVGPMEEPAAPAAAAAIIEEEIRISADPPFDTAPSRATTEAPPHGEPTARRAPSHAATEPVSGVRTWEGPDGGTSGDFARGPLGATERVCFFAPRLSEPSMGWRRCSMPTKSASYSCSWHLWGCPGAGASSDRGSERCPSTQASPMYHGQTPGPTTTCPFSLTLLPWPICICGVLSIYLSHEMQI